MYVYIGGSLGFPFFFLSFFPSHKRERKIDQRHRHTILLITQTRKLGRRELLPSHKKVYSVKSTHQPDQTRPGNQRISSLLSFSLFSFYNHDRQRGEGRGGETRQRRSIDGRRHSSSPKKLPIQFRSTTTT